MISPLATYTLISPFKNSPRNHTIDRISIHCFVGQVTAKRGAEVFSAPNKNASCNYCVGYDGSISCVVDENDRSWCTSSRDNDNRAVTIEVACETKHPYKVTDAAYTALLSLCEDICKRNGKQQLIWINDKEKALSYEPTSNEMVLTVHRWFANKACPGEYLLNKHDEISKEVTKRMNSNVSAWAQFEWQKCCSAGIFDGTNPQGTVTREMLAVILDRLGLIK